MAVQRDIVLDVNMYNVFAETVYLLFVFCLKSAKDNIAMEFNVTDNVLNNGTVASSQAKNCKGVIFKVGSKIDEIIYNVAQKVLSGVWNAIPIILFY